MPIDHLQQSIHIRRKKNQVVFQNIERLWDIGRKAQSHQDILDGLHPWGDSIRLKFDNTLPILLGCIGIICLFSIFIYPHHLWGIFCFGIGLFCLIWAYFSYEQNTSIKNIIAFLERESIAKRYQLAYGHQPQHISIPLNPTRFLIEMKQLFPVFQQGSMSNEITNYASTIWTDQNQKKHHIVVFQYHYIDEIRAKDKDGNEIKLREIHRDLWGVFIFDIEIQGLAITSLNKRFYYPYSFPWNSSDIQINQQLNFFGSNELAMAKLLTPALTLKIANFFEHRDADLLFHPSRNIMCYIGSQNLFQVSSHVKKIEDISALRGHLRTFKLPYLERLQNDLMTLLK